MSSRSHSMHYSPFSRIEKKQFHSVNVFNFKNYESGQKFGYDRKLCKCIKVQGEKSETFVRPQ